MSVLTILEIICIPVSILNFEGDSELDSKLANFEMIEDSVKQLKEASRTLHISSRACANQDLVTSRFSTVLTPIPKKSRSLLFYLDCVLSYALKRRCSQFLIFFNYIFY